LWGSLFLGLRASRRELDELLERLRRERSEVLRDEDAMARQEVLREEVRRAGWCIGVLAAAEGCDLLRERHAPEGLRWMIGALADARGLRLLPGAVELPLLAPACRSGGEVVVLAGWCARMSLAESGDLRWSAWREGARWRLLFAHAPEPAADIAARCARLACGEDSAPRLEVGQGGLALSWN